MAHDSVIFRAHEQQETTGQDLPEEPPAISRLSKKNPTECDTRSRIRASLQRDLRRAKRLQGSGLETGGKVGSASNNDIFVPEMIQIRRTPTT